MKRILSGIQSSGTPHLGNYLGAMKKHIDSAESRKRVKVVKSKIGKQAGAIGAALLVE